jgi:O-antigen/teichoic acid export membrane protein
MQIRLKCLKQKYSSLSEPVKASIWYMVCNILNKGMALISTPIFTRILTEEQYGIFSIFRSWYSILIIFTSLNIFLGGYTKGLLIFKNDWKAFTSSLLSLTTFITCCFGIIYCANSASISSFLSCRKY